MWNRVLVVMAQANIDLPDEPTFETYEHVATDPDDGTEIRFTFRADADRGKIEWTAEWDDGEASGHTDELSDGHGAIIYRHNPRINGEKTQGSKLDDEMLTALKADLEAAKQYRHEKREAEQRAKRAADLTLTVEEITYKTGTHRTKYTRHARVLKPNKDERHWDEDEQKLMDALRRELGESNGYPNAAGDDTENPFEDVDDGTELTAADAAARVDGIDDTLAAIDAERERKQARADLVDEYPALRGTNADPSDAREAIEDAIDSGERVEVARGTDSCRDPSAECNLDHVTYYATPDGEIDISRTHTF